MAITAKAGSRSRSSAALARAEEISRAITDDLGGWGLFGVELFVKGRRSMVQRSRRARPHTGLVTLVSQEPSEFALHARAILGLPIPLIRQSGLVGIVRCWPTARAPYFNNVATALQVPDTAVRLFASRAFYGHRRVGVTLARAETIDEARAIARDAADAIGVELRP